MLFRSGGTARGCGLAQHGLRREENAAAERQRPGCLDDAVLGQFHWFSPVGLVLAHHFGEHLQAPDRHELVLKLEVGQVLGVARRLEPFTAMPKNPDERAP